MFNNRSKESPIISNNKIMFSGDTGLLQMPDKLHFLEREQPTSDSLFTYNEQDFLVLDKASTTKPTITKFFGRR